MQPIDTSSLSSRSSPKGHSQRQQAHALSPSMPCTAWPHSIENSPGVVGDNSVILSDARRNWRSCMNAWRKPWRGRDKWSAWWASPALVSPASSTNFNTSSVARQCCPILAAVSRTPAPCRIHRSPPSCARSAALPTQTPQQNWLRNSGRVCRKFHRAPDEWTPYLQRLLGGPDDPEPWVARSPEAVKQHTFTAVRQLLLALSQQCPLLLALEDAHWIDKTSEDFLTLFVESCPRAAVLLLVTYRPGYRPPWFDKSYATQLALQPLPAQESQSLVESLVPEQAVSPDVLQALLSKAEGNPLLSGRASPEYARAWGGAARECLA